MIIMNVFCCYKTIGRFSELTVDGTELKLITIEQNYENNKPFVSSVPYGEYDLIEFNSPKYGDTYALQNKELGVYAFKNERENDDQRYACLFHPANRFDQLLGCIAPGLDFGYIPLKDKSPIFGVKKSKIAFDKLKANFGSHKKLKIQLSKNLIIE